MALVLAVIASPALDRHVIPRVIVVIPQVHTLLKIVAIIQIKLRAKAQTFLDGHAKSLDRIDVHGRGLPIPRSLRLRHSLLKPPPPPPLRIMGHARTTHGASAFITPNLATPCEISRNAQAAAAPVTLPSAATAPHNHAG